MNEVTEGTGYREIKLPAAMVPIFMFRLSHDQPLTNDQRAVLLGALRETGEAEGTPIILPESVIRDLMVKLSNDQALTDDQLAELLGALLRETGATSPPASS